MGIRSSCESSSSILTAKLILPDGTLQEFSKPVKVSQILARNPNCFVCSSDDMDFDSTPCAVDADDHLQIGELYFVLPLRLLNSPLRTPDMGALASKASQALNLRRKRTGVKNMFCGCGMIKRIDPPLILNKRVEKSNPVAADLAGTSSGGGGLRERKKLRAARCWGYWNFDVKDLKVLDPNCIPLFGVPVPHR